MTQAVRWSDGAVASPDQRLAADLADRLAPEMVVEVRK